jgi:hypothetical protein
MKELNALAVKHKMGFWYRNVLGERDLEWYPGEVEKVISKYATTNKNELVAEAMTQAYLSDNPSPFALDILELVKKYNGRKRKDS